jgi:hypothetical protein
MVLRVVKDGAKVPRLATATATVLVQVSHLKDLSSNLSEFTL